MGAALVAHRGTTMACGVWCGAGVCVDGVVLLRVCAWMVWCVDNVVCTINLHTYACFIIPNTHHHHHPLTHTPGQRVCAVWKYGNSHVIAV